MTTEMNQTIVFTQFSTKTPSKRAPQIEKSALPICVYIAFRKKMANG